MASQVLDGSGMRLTCLSCDHYRASYGMRYARKRIECAKLGVVIETTLEECPEADYAPGSDEMEIDDE